MESDGTYVSLQDGKKVEIKAMVAYAGKDGENRIKRINACHFGCIGNKTSFWTQAVGAVAENFDLSEVKKVHMGFDGDPTYKNAEGYFLINAELDGNLDPFQVNRAVGYCFKDDEDARKQVMSCLWYKTLLMLLTWLSHMRRRALSKRSARKSLQGTSAITRNS